MARPTELTVPLQNAVAADVKRGCSFADAAMVNGITATTLFNWRRRGKAGEEPFAAFFEALETARAESKKEAIDWVRNGTLASGAPDWKSQAWWLERMFPSEFGAQAAVNIKVEKELASALDRLREKLAPDVYDLVLSALAGEPGEDSIVCEEEGIGREAADRALP